MVKALCPLLADVVRSFFIGNYFYGLCAVALGLWWQRHEARIQAWLGRLVPRGLQNLYP